MDAGIVPERLVYRRKSVSRDAESSILVGSVPKSSLFRSRLRFCRFGIANISSGRDPTKLLETADILGHDCSTICEVQNSVMLMALQRLSPPPRKLTQIQTIDVITSETHGALITVIALYSIPTAFIPRR